MDVPSDDPQGPFEGPEKLLEIWFSPSADVVPDAAFPDDAGRTGLRKVHRKVWEEMLSIVKCQVLSFVQGDQMDAYLLSESSFFVSPHRLILKTCGTTLNLLGLPRILEIAANHANMHSVYRCFYSRKSFMFPERQLGPHKEWKHEVEYLDNFFSTGAAYTVGKVNGDHWLLYLTSPGDETLPDTLPIESNGSTMPTDYTIEILMSNLAATARAPFFSSLTSDDDPHMHAAELSQNLGIADIFPSHQTKLDAYTFTPCGYSANALVRWSDDLPTSIQSDSLASSHGSHEGYYTIHVTPEEGWSYASFECNIPSHASEKDPSLPDLQVLIQRVVRIFQPGRLSLTLFISSQDSEAAEESVEAAQRAFKAALANSTALELQYPSLRHSCPPSPIYKRTDKINYEFGGYDLAFASFERTV
ncbi:hypothetical protein H0H93_010230 [Arthromyces matolae]|nr:hypothetical protein H0H93_010230 [Arthromyces matolae]